MTISKTLTAAIAALAIATPAAVAKPVDDMHASTAVAAAQARQGQDLRSPDAIDAAQHPRKAQTGAPGATVVDSQSTRTPVAPGQPTWAVDPEPIPPAPAPATAKGDDGVDWTTIGIGIAGSLLVLGGLAALTTRVRTTARTGVRV